MLRRIMDPDFGMDIVECGFVKVLDIDDSKGHVDLTLELTTPACPVKDQFKREATQYVHVCDRQYQMPESSMTAHQRSCWSSAHFTSIRDLGGSAFATQAVIPMLHHPPHGSTLQELPWVSSVAVTITAQPKASTSDSGSDTARPGGLRGVRHIIAVSSCKGGVGKSTTAVNLAYTLAQMGAKVGMLRQCVVLRWLHDEHLWLAVMNR